MIPAATWLTLIRDAIAQYPSLGVRADAAILDLIREIQYDARSTILEDLEQYIKKQQLKKD